MTGRNVILANPPINPNQVLIVIILRISIASPRRRGPSACFDAVGAIHESPLRAFYSIRGRDYLISYWSKLVADHRKFKRLTLVFLVRNSHKLFRNIFGDRTKSMQPLAWRLSAYPVDALYSLLRDRDTAHLLNTHSAAAPRRHRTVDNHGHQFPVPVTGQERRKT